MEKVEQILNYREIPIEVRNEVLNTLESIGFIPAYGGIKTMKHIMDKSISDFGPQFYFVFRDDELIGYSFLIGDASKYKSFPYLAISNMDELNLELCEKLMELQISFFESLGMHEMVKHCMVLMKDYRDGIGKRKESECR